MTRLIQTLFHIVWKPNILKIVYSRFGQNKFCLCSLPPADCFLGYKLNYTLANYPIDRHNLFLFHLKGK